MDASSTFPSSSSLAPETAVAETAETVETAVIEAEEAPKPEGVVYLSFDIEADGDAPSVNNLLSIGIFAFDSSGSEVTTYQRNLFPHPTKVADERCIREFWDKHPEVSAFVKTNQVSPEQCMQEIADFYTGLKTKFAKIKWVARPAAYDWQWLNCYYHEFGPADKPSIGFKARCISTMFDVYKSNNQMTQEEEDAAWNEMTAGYAMTHNPLDDAKFQAVLYIGLCERLNMAL